MWSCCCCCCFCCCCWSHFLLFHTHTHTHAQPNYFQLSFKTFFSLFFSPPFFRKNFAKRIIKVFFSSLDSIFIYFFAGLTCFWLLMRNQLIRHTHYHNTTSATPRLRSKSVAAKAAMKAALTLLLLLHRLHTWGGLFWSGREKVYTSLFS